MSSAVVSATPPDFSRYNLSFDGGSLSGEGPTPLISPMSDAQPIRTSLSSQTSYFTEITHSVRSDDLFIPRERANSLVGSLLGISGDSTKQSRGGGVKLRLANAKSSEGMASSFDAAALPVYGLDSYIDGYVELAKPEGLTSLEAKIEGKLKLREVGGGGNTFSTLCLDTAILWSKDRNNMGSCPSSFSFRLKLPNTITVDSKVYELPPSHEVHVSGIPGFRANIEYAVSVTTHRPNLVPSKFLPHAMDRSKSTVSAPFIFYPRSRPQSQLPPPLQPTTDGFDDTPGWMDFETVIQRKNSSEKASASQNIDCKLYLPSSRVFSMAEAIPFRILLRGSSVALASYMPFGPTSNTKGEQATKIQIIRQSIIDVRNRVEFGTKTDMWRVDNIAESGTFRFLADGQDWIAFAGEVKVKKEIKIAGFKVAGLAVKDCVVLSTAPLEPNKCPFRELRLVVPIQLTTDLWHDGSRRSMTLNSHSEPSSAGSGGFDDIRARQSSVSSQYSNLSRLGKAGSPDE